MSEHHLSTNVAQPFSVVNTQLPLFPGTLPRTMIHHKVGRNTHYLLVDRNVGSGDNRYGVSSSRRVLSPGLLLKRFDQVRDCLQYGLCLTTAQREVTLKMLRLWAYYGQVYPKSTKFSEQPGSSHATFWRTIKFLGERGLIQTINRFLLRPHAQISNLYRLDKLLVIIARYLSEHGHRFYEKWLQPMLELPGTDFWRRSTLGDIYETMARSVTGSTPDSQGAR